MKRRRSHRPERVEAMIHQGLARVVATRLKDPRVGFVTITGVVVTSDLSHAKVRVSVMGDEDAKSDALAGLRSARGFIRSALADSAELRTVPELHFELDRGLEHAATIDRLLDQIDKGES